MELRFAKMHGAANDFVVLEGAPPTAVAAGAALVRALCDRRQGVGADGVLWIERSGGRPGGRVPAFRMHFYNSDGCRAALCLNGGRCCALRARELGWVAAERFVYLTDIGEIEAEVGPAEVSLWIPAPRRAGAAIALPEGSPAEQGIPVVTGDPHLVVELDAPRWDQLDLETAGRALRWWTGAFQDGNNVHFIHREPAVWQIRTFERGVEGETWACGSGCIAAVCALQEGAARGEVALRTRAGFILAVTPGPAVWQIRGPAATVFMGTWRTEEGRARD
jgi:diaminopimelate epimerase